MTGGSERARLRRSRRLGGVGALGLVLVLAGCHQEPTSASHLVLVVFDTLRADRMSVYGYAKETTPFLQSLAEESLLFARAKAPSPWTVPSHASIFTGMLPARHGAQWGRMYLDSGFTTLAEILGEWGFCTLGLSANELVNEDTGLTQGFARFRSFGGGTRHRSEQILAALESALEEVRDRGCRLFAFVNLMDSHIPYNAQDFAREFGAQGAGPVRTPRVKWAINAGQRPFPPEDRRLHSAAYDAAVRRLDEVASAITALLASSGQLDETLLVLTSDHGEGLGIHPEIGHTISLWEEQLAVPLLIRFPSGWRAGEVVSTPVGLDALLPSVLDWLSVARPESLAGAPGLLTGRAEPVVADYRSYFSESNRRMNAAMKKRYPQLAERVDHGHALFCGDHKLIVRSRQGRFLFNLRTDPSELENLAARSPSELEGCLRMYREALAGGRLTPFDHRPSDESLAEAERRLDLEALRSLGYVQ